MHKKILMWSLLALFIVIGTHSGAVAAEGPTHSGEVLETITGGSYTYMNIDENGSKYWIAGPRSEITKGSYVSFSEQVWMSNFKSRALDRTFDRLLFVGGIMPATKPAAPVPSASAGNVTPKTDGTYTVEQIYSNKSALSGKTVKVKGSVVKVTKMVMGRNWIHIEDGTGSGPTSKLVFRAVSGLADVGSVVTAQGRLVTDKDFGYGYFYPAIVEDSTFTK